MMGFFLLSGVGSSWFINQTIQLMLIVIFQANHLSLVGYAVRPF